MTTNNFRATPLRGRMQQVAMTYLTRPILPWAGGLGFLFVSLAIYFASPEQNDDTDPESLIFVGLPVFPFSVLLALHVKWQFVNPAARLCPITERPISVP